MPTEFAKRLSKRIQTELDKHGITQEQFAEALGVQQSTISRRLAGKHAFPLTDLPVIADLFGITVSDLLGGQAADQSEQHSVSPAPTPRKGEPGSRSGWTDSPPPNSPSFQTASQAS